MNVNAQESKLIYVGDPMCSWCYGISEELAAVKTHFSESLDFEMVMGGLRPYNTETMSDLKSFLTHHWEDVHSRSGQEFSYEILDNTEITYDTEPPSRASIVVRQLDASKEYSFFKGIQKLFYLENKNMHLVESYHGLLEQLGIDITEFDRLFHSDEMKEKTKQDFQRSANLSVSSFPTVILKKDGEYFVVARGYATQEQMIKSIESVQNN